MKHIYHYLFVFLFSTVMISCNNQNENKQKKGQIQIKTEKALTAIAFEKASYDFGTIYEGEKVTYSFIYTNIGKADLQLSSVATTCGCTASEYTTDPIKPGETGKIRITFNSANRLGMQHKKVIIRANTNPEFTSLNVYAQVIEKKSEN